MKEEIEKQLADLKAQVDSLSHNQPENKISMIVFSGDLDKVLAAFVIATWSGGHGHGSGYVFYLLGHPAFEGQAQEGRKGKDLMGTMFGTMLPKGVSQVKLSKMNMAGMGTSMMKSLMKKKNVASLEQMIEMAGELGVKIYVCEMSMDLMGFKREEMISYPDLTYCGVAKFLDEAMDSKIQLFI